MQIQVYNFKYQIQLACRMLTHTRYELDRKYTCPCSLFTKPFWVFGGNFRQFLQSNTDAGMGASGSSLGVVVLASSLMLRTIAISSWLCKSAEGCGKAPWTWKNCGAASGQRAEHAESLPALFSLAVAVCKSPAVGKGMLFLILLKS